MWSRHSDEEDDVIGHHHLVVVLHAPQGGAHLGLGEALLAALVDVVHQGGHLDRLGVGRLEDGEQRRLELLQPGERREREAVRGRALEPDRTNTADLIMNAPTITSLFMIPSLHVQIL